MISLRRLLQNAIVALGSNLGDSRKILLDAMARLQNFSDEPLLKSSLWQTSPVDCPPDSPKFLNAVVALVSAGQAKRRNRCWKNCRRWKRNSAGSQRKSSTNRARWIWI